MLAKAWLLPMFAVLGACNMVISEAPMFAESDRASVAVRDGIWLSKADDCYFDPAPPEAKWPECAVWVVVRKNGRELLMSDGKGQTQSLDGLIATGIPLILQAKWEDDAKDSKTVTYGYYAIEWRQPVLGGFTEASIWAVACGVQDPPGSKIQPYPGISPECRPSTKDAIRSAATASRTGEMSIWRWLRAETP